MARKALVVTQSLGYDGDLHDGESNAEKIDANFLELYTAGGPLIPVSDTNAGVGDQVNLTDTAAHVFTEKASVAAAVMLADDFLVIDWAVWVDGVNGTPALTIEVLVGTTVVRSEVIATAAANDWAHGHDRIKCTAVGASLTGEITSTGATKDGTVAATSTLQKAKAITASSTAGFDVTVRVTSDAGHASNLATLRTLSIAVERATA